MKILAPWIFILLLGIPPNKALSQTATKTAVEVLSTSNDLAGQRLVYLIKEGIRKSSSMRLTYDDESRLQLHIVTLERNPQNPGSETVYTIAWTFKIKGEVYSYFLNNDIGFAGYLRLQEAADGEIAITDDQLSKFLTH